MSLPIIPAGLPSSCVVLGHFSAFCKAEPVRSVEPDCVAFFGDFLAARVSPEEAVLILERAKYPL